MQQLDAPAVCDDGFYYRARLDDSGKVAVERGVYCSAADAASS